MYLANSLHFKGIKLHSNLNLAPKRHGESLNDGFCMGVVQKQIGEFQMIHHLIGPL